MKLYALDSTAQNKQVVPAPSSVRLFGSVVPGSSYLAGRGAISQGSRCAVVMSVSCQVRAHLDEVGDGAVGRRAWQRVGGQVEACKH